MMSKLPPTPVSPYGQVKAENEKLFVGTPNCLVVRTSLIYDLNPNNRQISWMLRKIKVGEPVPLFRGRDQATHMGLESG